MEAKNKSVVAEAPPASEIPKIDIGVALWMILFVLGGGLLALYYARIGYFPEVSWQDSLSYLALMTIIGGSLLVAYSFLLFVPGAIWSEQLIFDEQINPVLMMDARSWEPCVLSVSKRILFPFALFMASSHFLFFLYRENLSVGFVPLGAIASLFAVTVLLCKDLREGLERREALRKKIEPTPSTITVDRRLIGLCHAALFIQFLGDAAFGRYPATKLLWGAALLPMAGAFVVLLRDRKSSRLTGSGEKSIAASDTLPSSPVDRPSEAPLTKSDELSVLCRIALAFGIASLLSLMALWFFYRIYHGGGSQGVPTSLLLLCTLVVSLANLAVSVLFHEHRRSALLTSFLSALLLLGAGQLVSRDSHSPTLPAKIMEKFGFGRQSASLVLTEKGGWLLSMQKIAVHEESREVECKAAKDSGASPGNTQAPCKEKAVLARADGLAILSRLGSEYLLLDPVQNRIVTVPKGEVVSWSMGSWKRDSEKKMASCRVDDWACNRLD